MFFWRGILFGIVFGVPAGAIGALTIQRTLGKGFSFGLATGLGSSFADLIYALLSAFAFGTFSSIILRWQTPMRIFGGALIFLIGISVLLKKSNVRAGKNVQGDFVAHSKVAGILFSFPSSFLVAIVNPAAILSFAAAFSSLDLVKLKEGANAALLVAGIFTGTIIWWLLLTGGVSMFRKKITEKIYGILNKVLGSLLCLLGVVVVIGVFTSFSSPKKLESIAGSENLQNDAMAEIAQISLSENLLELDKCLRAVSFVGDDGFDFFLERGGASSDKEVASFLTKMLSLNDGDITLETKGFACSAFSAESEDGGRIFGRNFDWYKCDALIVRSTPTNGYASVSTVNMDFLNKASPLIRVLPEKAKTFASLYAPLDGMNEKGLCVAVLMIADSPAANQNTGKSGLTTTTAVRALLNKAATTDEAVAILRGHDMHASMNLTVHFAISDASGKTVAAEYVDNQLVIIQSNVVTNFYLALGKKNGKGTAQSHERFDILKTALSATPSLSESKAASLLERVCKAHWHDGETTEWSIVFNQQNLTATYFHRENYGRGWKIEVMPFSYTSP